MTDQKPAPVAPASPLMDAAALDALANEAATSTAPGDPAAPPAEPDVPTAELVAMILGPAFAIVAPNWNVRESEIDQLGKAYGAVLDKYFPDGLGNYGAELTAVFCTLAIVAPRRGKPLRAPEKEPVPVADASA